MEGELEQAQRANETKSRQLLEVQAVMHEMEEKIQVLEVSIKSC